MIYDFDTLNNVTTLLQNFSSEFGQIVIVTILIIIVNTYVALMMYQALYGLSVY